MANSIRSSAPFGNIYQVGTPYLDQLSNQLYAEQRQRQLEQQKQNAALDEQFSNNLANVRTADIGDLTKAYNDWKQARISTMNQHRLTPEQQLGVLQKKANLYKLINGSKQQLGVESDIRKGLASKPDSYEDNAHQILGQSMQTPLSRLGDLANHDYSYKGTDFDFGAALKNAAGAQKPSYQASQPMDKAGLQTQVTPYQYGNTPAQYHDNLLATLGNRKALRSAQAIVDTWTPETIAQVQDKYQSIPAETWQKMGVAEPQDLTITPDDTKAEVFAKHNAQLYALNNEPKQGKIYTIDNKAAERNQALQDAKEKANFNDQLIRGRMATAQGYKKALVNFKAAKTSEGQEGVLNKFINTSYDEGTDVLDSSKVDHMTIGGKDYKGKFVAIPETIKSDFAVPLTYESDDGKHKKGEVILDDKGKPSYAYPTSLYLTTDKKTIIPVFAGDKTQTGGNYLKPQSKPMPVQNLKVSLGKLLLSKTKLGSEVTDDGDVDEEFGVPSTESESVKGNNKSYDINNPKNWKQEGNDFRFADGSLYRLNSKTGKMDKIK